MVLIALILAASGLRVIGARKKAPPPVDVPPSETETAAIETVFVLTLSAPARHLSLEAAGVRHQLDPSARTISGNLSLEDGHPVLFVDIEWSDREPAPRFAKLVLEPVGFPTMTRVFDSTGDLSDAWEIHLHHGDHD